MLKEMEKNLIFNDTLTVLILILMEHAQRAEFENYVRNLERVES